MPMVSVIVPNYNHAKFLKQRLESIYNQSFRDFEVILLDDCSSDESIAILKVYQDHPHTSHFIINEKNSGSPFIQWQKGISLAKGKYIWIAESDDYCSADFLETGMKELATGADLFYCHSVTIDEPGNFTNKIEAWYTDLFQTRWQSDYIGNTREEVENYLSFKNTIPNASAVIFRNRNNLQELLRKVTGMKYCGDWLFWILYLEEAGKISYSIATSNFFRHHPTMTRISLNKKSRNSEVFKIAAYIITNRRYSGKLNVLVNYYFKNHVYVFSKRYLIKNGLLAIRSFLISPYFFTCWVKYYFNMNIEKSVVVL